MKTIEGKVVMLGSQGKRSSVNEAIKLPNYRYVMPTKGHLTLRCNESRNGEDAIAYLDHRVIVFDSSFTVRLGERYP